MRISTLSFPVASSSLEFFLWSMVMLAALLVMGLLILLLRRALRGGGRDDTLGGLSIDELEVLRATGGISDEEFRTLRRIALGIGPPTDEKTESALTTPEKVDDEEPDGGSREDDVSAGDTPESKQEEQA